MLYWGTYLAAFFRLRCLNSFYRKVSDNAFLSAGATRQRVVFSWTTSSYNCFHLRMATLRCLNKFLFFRLRSVSLFVSSFVVALLQSESESFHLNRLITFFDVINQYLWSQVLPGFYTSLPSTNNTAKTAYFCYNIERIVLFVLIFRKEFSFPDKRWILYGRPTTAYCAFASLHIRPFSSS